MPSLRMLIAVVLCLVLGACAPTSPAGAGNSVTGLPEVTIANATKWQIVSRLLDAKRRAGMRVLTASERELTVSTQVAGNMWGGVTISSDLSSMKDVELTYRLVDAKGGTRVTSQARVITNPGSAYERINEVTPIFASRLQAELESLRSALAPK